MSFNSTFDNDIERIATNHSHKYKDYPEFESLSTSIDNQLHHISQTQLSTIKHDLLQFEKDPLDLSIAEKLSSEFKQTTESYRKLNDFVKQLNNTIKSVEDEREDVEIINYLKQKESIQIKLIRDSLGNFKNYQRRFESKQSSQLPAPGDNTINPHQDQEQHSQQQSQQQIQITYEPVNAEELEQQTLLIQEREREIHQIQQDTQEINNIFSNLSSIINEQQFQVDSIENNIFTYSSNARQASNELRSAHRYQKRSSGTLFCCLMILLAVLGFIILIGLIF
ncbi:Pep12 protein [Candida orthopsilosis Co 90-125]|uniref:Pep12 protein n=1 Tax=Candida orthopsilosis (strain 90-125) TaxID=1136231 RepID=H8X820_CANO9|nr:Pep12 protein [Candida orthopsilosis Co 90-125]CCG24119.1 Pep12 protein [Candida orthopsilosis Co 90-125]